MTWMTHEQSDFLKSKVDGFCLSQLQGEVAAYCTNTYREWFEKWPEIAAHFKDDAGIPITESQLTSEQMKELGVFTKRRHSVCVIFHFHFGSLIAIVIANTFLFISCVHGFGKGSRHPVCKDHHQNNGYIYPSHSRSFGCRTLHPDGVQGQS